MKSTTMPITIGLCGALLAFGVSGATAQFHGERKAPERVVKEKRADGSLVLDESGLTNNFETMKRMMRWIDNETIDGKEVEVHTGRLPLMGIDWESFQNLESGLVEFQVVGAIKMKTAATLKFGDLTIGAGNVAPDYPGLYSLWIRKVSADDWRLIFNHEADAWGTMHDPAQDVGEVPLTHTVDEAASTPSLMIDLEPNESGDGGLLKLGWGAHKWSVPFANS